MGQLGNIIDGIPVGSGKGNKKEKATRPARAKPQPKAKKPGEQRPTRQYPSQFADADQGAALIDNDGEG